MAGIAIASLVLYLTGAQAAGEAPLFQGKSAEAWHWRYVKAHKAHSRLGVELRAQREKTHRAQQSLRNIITSDLYGSHYLERALLCIHGYEGDWNDPNAPYWGGLQMDLQFQRTYGAEFLAKFGTADKWPISVQMAVAIRAFLSGRGFYPWPNTARYCGLLP